MDQVLANRLPEVAAICRRHRVARLDVFGSAARQTHGAADLDFLVEFEDLPADAYFGLLSALEALFERPVDLVMASAVKNPFVRETIERSRIRSMLPEARAYLHRMFRCCNARSGTSSLNRPAGHARRFSPSRRGARTRAR